MGARSPHAFRRRLLAAAALLLAGAHAHAQTFTLQRTYLGQHSADQFGIAASPIGDINQDGRADFAIGANVNDTGASGGGRVYVFLGGNITPVTFSLAFAGNIASGQAGAAISGGADFDHDGYDDWIVGAPGAGTSGTAPGRAYVFRGGAVLDTIPDLTLQGTTAGGQFGAAVLAVRDLDGDGFGDFVVGAPRAGRGRVSIYRGSAVLNGTADRIIHARAADDRFGKSLASLPDTNADGRDDLLVGVPRNSQVGTWAGAVLLYRGTAALDSIVDLTLTGMTAGEEFGTSIAAGFDVSGDGAPDVLVGAPYANPGTAVDAGRASLFRAGAVLDATADLVIPGQVASDHLGTSVGMGFDWDGDGRGDFVIGVPDRDIGFADSGACWVYRGGSVLDGTADGAVNGGAADRHLGTAVAGVGDVRHNGRPMLLLCGFGSTDTGRALLYGSNAAPTDAAAPGVPALAHWLAPQPNPFNPTTTLQLAVASPGHWVIDILDARGHRVRTLWSGALGPGFHAWRWDGHNDAERPQPSGVYFVRARSAETQATTRATLVR